MHFVPSPIDDELLYGLGGRWWKRSGLRDPEFFMRAAFGPTFDSGSLRGSLPAALASTCGVVCTHEQALEQHTLLPFYRPFMNASLFGQLSRADSTEDQAPARARLRGQASITINELRYCPLCASSQVGDEGIATWLRSHNLPFVRACWLHGCALISTRLSTDKRPKLVPRTLAGVQSADVDDRTFAIDCRRLLMDSRELAGSAAIATAWRHYLSSRFGGFSGAARALLETASGATLRKFQIAANETSVTYRMRNLADDRAAARNPVFALLLKCLLPEQDFSSILRGVAPASPAGRSDASTWGQGEGIARIAL
jgi:hypothetical protein